MTEAWAEGVTLALWNLPIVRKGFLEEGKGGLRVSEEQGSK